MPLKITRKDQTTKRSHAHTVEEVHPKSKKRADIGDSRMQAVETTVAQPEPVRIEKTVADLTPRSEVPATPAPSEGKPAVRFSEIQISRDPIPGFDTRQGNTLHDVAAQRSFTLYKKDCQLIRDVQVYFLQNGCHITESQVVRIALRALEISDRLPVMHAQIKSEDGRKHRQSDKRAAAALAAAQAAITPTATPAPTAPAA